MLVAAAGGPMNVQIDGLIDRNLLAQLRGSPSHLEQKRRDLGMGVG